MHACCARSLPCPLPAVPAPCRARSLPAPWCAGTSAVVGAGRTGWAPWRAACMLKPPARVGGSGLTPVADGQVADGQVAAGALKGPKPLPPSTHPER